MIHVKGSMVLAALILFSTSLAWTVAGTTAGEAVVTKDGEAEKTSRREESLRICVKRVCETLAKDDFKAFQAFVDDPDMTKQYGEMTWGETAFARMKEIQAKEDYLKLLVDQIPTQREKIEKGVFTLGGHAHGHLHIEMKEADGTWRIARFKFCR